MVVIQIQYNYYKDHNYYKDLTGDSSSSETRSQDEVDSIGSSRQ